MPLKRKRNNGWTPERRRAATKATRTQKPWLQATGPRTAKGKAVAARNSWKHGARSAPMRDIEKVLRKQKTFLSNLRALRELANSPLHNTVPRLDSREGRCYHRLLN